MSMNKTCSVMLPRQQGFSLIEVMVAMVIGIVILLAVSEVFINNNRTSIEIDRTGRQIENGIFALNLLEDELANAGYWGEAGAQPVGALSPLCPTTSAELTAAMGYPIQGELGSGVDCSDAKAGSSFIAVRRASTCAVGDAGCAPANSNFHIQVSSCQSESPGVVDLAAGTSALLDATQRDCSTVAPIYRLLSRVYYVNDADVLSRAELSSGNYTSVTSLVEGIEVIRFEYGLDTSGDGQVDVFTVTPVGAQWADVTAVKVSLVARNIQPTLGYVDAKTYTVGGASYAVPEGLQQYKRQVYSTTVHLRNVAGRREVP